MEEIKIEQRQENQSSTLGKLAEALSNAQSCIEGSKMDAVNPFFKSNYSTLASVWDACRKPLTKNGLSVVQTMSNDEGKVVIITTLLHSSGEWIRGSLAVKPMKDDPQAMGSAITYGRRYSLAAIAGISPEDDDAEGTMERDKKKPPLTEPQSKGKTKSREDPLAKSKRMIWARMGKITSDKAEWKKMAEEAGCPPSSKDWKKEDIDKLVKHLDDNQLRNLSLDGKLPEDNPSEDELTPEKCHELVGIYKGMISEIANLRDLEAWEKANKETIKRVRVVEPEAYVALMTAYDAKYVELQKIWNAYKTRK